MARRRWLSRVSELAKAVWRKTPRARRKLEAYESKTGFASPEEAGKKLVVDARKSIRKAIHQHILDDARVIQTMRKSGSQYGIDLATVNTANATVRFALSLYEKNPNTIRKKFLKKALRLYETELLHFIDVSQTDIVSPGRAASASHLRKHSLSSLFHVRNHNAQELAAEIAFTQMGFLQHENVALQSAVAEKIQDVRPLSRVDPVRQGKKVKQYYDRENREILSSLLGKQVREFLAYYYRNYDSIIDGLW